MYKSKRQLPLGVQDYLADECYNLRLAEQRIKNVFALAGYDEIKTPAFEYIDVFNKGIGAIKQEHMLKFFDSEGRTLALRPDMTMPLARVACSRLESFPARLCYIGEAFGCEDAYYSSQREFTQAGVELIGSAGPYADAEVISLAIESLKAAGLSDFTIDIGQVGFFKGLMTEAGLDDEQSEAVREYIDQKNDVALEYFLRSMSIGDSVKQKIMQLPALYGGPEVFDDALKVSSCRDCVRAISNIREIYDILCDFGYEKYISIDLGMLQSIDYYTGAIFKGISPDIGCSLLSGGRYDELLSRFGKPLAATGFAMGLKRILIALERKGALTEAPKPSFVISCTAKARKAAYEKLTQLREAGETAVAAFDLGPEQLDELADTLDAIALYMED